MRGCVLKIKIQTCRGAGGMLPGENFRNFEMPWTTFHEFSWQLHACFSKNNDAQIWPKIKNNILKNNPGRDLES